MAGWTGRSNGWFFLTSSAILKSTWKAAAATNFGRPTARNCSSAESASDHRLRTLFEQPLDAIRSAHAEALDAANIATRKKKPAEVVVWHAAWRERP
jgi:hypothetical protein